MPNAFRVAQAIALVNDQAANGTLFSLRWSHATKLLLLTYARLMVVQNGNHTAALNDERFQLFVARAFTASDSGGAAVTLSGHNLKARTSMDSSVIATGDMRYSNAAAGLTAGTRTLDSNPIIELQAQFVATQPTSPVPPFVKEYAPLVARGDHPVLLAQNEGLVVRGPTTVFGAAGPAVLTVDLAWAELDTY